MSIMYDKYPFPYYLEMVEHRLYVDIDSIFCAMYRYAYPTPDYADNEYVLWYSKMTHACRYTNDGLEMTALVNNRLVADNIKWVCDITNIDTEIRSQIYIAANSVLFRDSGIQTKLIKVDKICNEDLEMKQAVFI